MHYLVWGSLFEEVPKGTWITVPKQEYGGVFLQEQKPDAITAKFETT